MFNTFCAGAVIWINEQAHRISVFNIFSIFVYLQRLVGLYAYVHVFIQKTFWLIT